MIRLCIVLALLASVPAAASELAPSGTLRAAFIGRNPVQGTVDATTREVRGPAADLTRELARRENVPFAMLPLANAPAVIAAVKSGEADIGFVAFDPVRAAEIDFSAPYSLAHNTYMVRADSAIRALADIDRAGHRIGVGERDAADFFLTRNLKSAELKRNPTGNLDIAVRQVTAGEIDAYAANRQRLSELASRTQGLRLLDENFYGVQQSIAVAKGATARLARVDAFLNEARAAGLIAAAIARAGLVGVDVAPPR
jgi:polar amino acid transport system substrate-binding protein